LFLIVKFFHKLHYRLCKCLEQPPADSQMLGLKIVPIIVIQFNFKIKMIVLRHARGININI